MKIHVNFLPNKLFPCKFTAIKSSNLIPNRTTNHSQFNLNLFIITFLGHFKDKPIKDITNLSNKIILRINKA